MRRILKGLYVGNAGDAQDYRGLQRRRVTHILNCAIEVPCFFRGDFTYLELGLTDPDPNFADAIPDICAFIKVGRREGGVLVHCSAGMNRGPSAVLAYLCHRGRRLVDALDLLRADADEDEEGEAFVEPNDDFLSQLEDYFENRRRSRRVREEEDEEER
ncbi:MAG: dual specificity protein phosphatase family protein [Planctomycetes bacterium]|nr:dual specificity protein phosphatase family protein [Planctomycetota bacterium]